MRIETVGKRQYAFGLAWSEGSRKPGKVAFDTQRASLAAAKRAHYYYCILQSGGHFGLGGVVLQTRAKGKLYSYAGTLARTQQDGLYVAALDANTLWFCVIQNGMVVPETDVVDSRPAVLARIAEYRSLLNLDAESIHASEDVVLPGGSQPFDADAAALVTGPLALRLQSSPMALVAPAIVVVALVLAVIVGLKFYKIHEAEVQHQIVTEQQRQTAITNYKNSVHAALSGFPASAGWAAGAVAASFARFPAFMDGWYLSEVRCVPSGCDGTYKPLTPDGPRLVSPFRDRFGSAHVSISPRGDELKIHFAITTAMVAVTEGLLHQPPMSGMSLLDWTGLVPVYVGSARGVPHVTAVNLAATGGGSQVGYPPLMTETVGLQGVAPIAVALPQVLAWSAKGAFKATVVQFTPGFGTSGASKWSITVERIHG